MSLGVTPNVVVRAYRERGGFFEQVACSRVHNLIPDAGLNFTRDYFSGTRSRPDEIAIGDGATAEAAGDTALDNETFRKAISRRFSEEKRVTFQMLIDQTEANGTTINEIGLFQGSTLLARAVISPAINKTSALVVTVSHEWTFSNA